MGFLHFGSFRRRKSRKSKGPWKWLPEKERTLRNGRCCCFCGVPLISAPFGGRFCGFHRGSEMASGKRSEHCEMDDFCYFCGVPVISAAFGGGNPKNPRGPGNGFRKRSEFCEMDDFAASFLGGVPLHFGSFRRPEIQKIHEALEMASGKGANIAKWTMVLLLWGFPSFRQLSAAGNRENPKGPGNGFRKRSEHGERDNPAAFVVFPSFRQLSAARYPENLRGPGNGFRKRSEHWEMDDLGFWPAETPQKLNTAP